MENQTLNTYSKLIKYPQLKTSALLLSKFIEQYPIECIYGVEDKSTLMGIEVEVENLPDAPDCSPFWMRTEDGSLRNYGREYISLPLRANTIEYALRYLFENLKGHNYKFSPRCSVHVHLNVRTMTPAQVYHLILVYLLFEKQIFNWVGHDRDMNIHCVPLYDTVLITHLKDSLNGGFNIWHKYTALNVLPIQKRGTIEFRHMHGTDDIEKLMTWINIILKLKMFVYRNDDIEASLKRLFLLNSTSQYRQFAYNVFGKEITDKLLDNSDYILNMEKGVCFAKRLWLGRGKVPQSKKGTIFAKLQAKLTKQIHKDDTFGSVSYSEMFQTLSPPPTPQWTTQPEQLSINQFFNGAT